MILDTSTSSTTSDDPGLRFSRRVFPTKDGTFFINFNNHAIRNDNNDAYPNERPSHHSYVNNDVNKVITPRRSPRSHVAATAVVNMLNESNLPTIASFSMLSTVSSCSVIESSVDNDESKIQEIMDSSTSPEVNRIFPVSNWVAASTVGAVSLYSATFLIYAQRHTIVLLIMTGLIGIFIILLYVLGILSFIYLMIRIDEMEEIVEKMSENVAYITVNKSYGAMDNQSAVTALTRLSTSHSTCSWRYNSQTTPDDEQMKNSPNVTEMKL